MRPAVFHHQLRFFINFFMNFRAHLKQTIGLTLPLVAGNVATLSMSFVDTVMVGHLGARELAAVGLGGAIWMTYTLFIIGLTMVLAPMISHLTGEGRRSEVGALVHQMLYLSLLMGGLLWLALMAVSFYWSGWGQSQKLYRW